jgi:ATP-dependent exoDNAse (exonuclease V) alpha subunit
MTNLSPLQAEAVEKIKTWMSAPKKQVFRLFGYAGTGKTTTIAAATEQLGLRVAYIAYTGKAASVMRNNGLPAETLHSLIYLFDHEDKQKGELYFSLNPESAAKTADLIVLDECSMVGDNTARDLLSFGTPVLAIGDPAQLPPVKGAGYFTNVQPDLLLTEVHRQALDSPVLKLATMVREGVTPGVGHYGDSRIMLGSSMDEDRLWSADQVLVGTNATRNRLNRRARAHFNMQSDYPQFGDKVVCLRNSHKHGVLNGELFTVLKCEELSPNWLSMSVVNNDSPTDKVVEGLPVHKGFFNGTKMQEYEESRSAHFDYGYALTVHKSQGSQWNDVIIVDESAMFREHMRNWLYTGITRAAERVTIVRGKV